MDQSSACGPTGLSAGTGYHGQLAVRPDRSQITRHLAHLDSLARNLRRLGFAAGDADSHVGGIECDYRRHLCAVDTREQAHG